MTLFIWILALFLMGFWTLLAWLTYKLLLWVGRLPWDQTLQQAKELPVPAFVAPWWQQTVDSLAPLLEMSQGLLAGLVQFAGAALPFVIGPSGCLACSSSPGWQLLGVQMWVGSGSKRGRTPHVDAQHDAPSGGLYRVGAFG